MLYVNGAVPPEPLAVIEPLLEPHEEETEVAVTVGAFELVMVVFNVLVQPFASFTVTVYEPAASPPKKLPL